MKRIIGIIALALVGCDDIFETDISNERIVLVAPADEAQTVQGEVTFLWQALEGADAYQITVVSPDFSKPARVVADTTIRADSVTSASFSLGVNLLPGHYQWRVRGINSGYATADRINRLNVITGDKDISAVIVSAIAPLNHVTAPAGEVLFLWRPLDGATSYRITIVSPSFAQASRAIADRILADTVLSFSQELEPGAYQWSLQASNPSYSTRELIYTLNVAAPEPQPEPDPDPMP